MFNSTKLILDYCGNETNTVVWNDELHTFGACFLFTLVENPVYFVSTLILAYMIGNLRQPDELDRVLQGLRHRKKTELFFLFLEFLTILITILCHLIDKLDYYSLYKPDYNGYVNFALKFFTLALLAGYTLKSLKCYNYSFCRLIALNLILTALITTEIVHLSWIKVTLRIFTFLDKRLIHSYAKLISIFTYFSIYNFAFFVTKRHSLYYESFANYDSSFNLDTIHSLNNHRKGLFSKLLFNWVQPFLVKALNDQVRNEADIFHLPEALTSEHVKGRIDDAWTDLVRSASCALRDSDNASQISTTTRNSGDDSYTSTDRLNRVQLRRQITRSSSRTNDDHSFDLQNPDDTSIDQPNRQSTSVSYNTDHSAIELFGSMKLRKVLWAAYRAELFRVSNLKLVADIFAFLSPILLQKLIDYFDSKDFSAYGFLLVLSLIASQLISSISVNLYDFLINNICIKVKSSVVNIVYRKLFSLRTSTLHGGFSNGQLVNFSSLDADRVANFFSSFFLVFSMPLQVFVALYLLYLQIGYSFIAGLIFAILLLGINKFISYKIALITNKLLAFKDHRIKLTTKLITGYKTIKMNNWQDIYNKQIDAARKKEMRMLKQKKMLDAICVYFWATTPVVTSFLTFGTFVLFGNKLTASNVFTSLALLNMLINPLNSLPWVFTGILESWISVNRIQAFLDSNWDEDMMDDECRLEKGGENPPIDPEHAVKFEDVVCEHVADGFLLGPIDLKVKRGEFLGIIGQVGSGKTSLLNAILNEVKRKREGLLESGRIELNLNGKGIGYVSQTPWLQNDTIKNNILFGKSYEYKYYHDVIDACDLRKDFETFNDYDNELISDRGVSLSGGQKARIALARALYQNFDLYLIDDPFNSLDQHVSSHIYENCILKHLSSKTRIVCTNQIEYLKDADRVVVMENGGVKQVGKPEEVLNDLLKNPLGNRLTKDKSCAQLIESTVDAPIDNEFKEEFEKGKVKLSVYSTYIRAISISLSICIVAFVMAMQSSSASSSVWLSYWTDRLKVDVESDSMYYLKVLLIIMLVNSLLAAFRAVLFALGCINAATNLYNQLYQTVVSSKLNFITARPIGQILNRFSSDVFHIDENLPFTLNIFLANAVSLFATVIITGYSVPISLFCLFLLSFPYYKIQLLYREGSMVLKRISTNTLSPLYSQFHETLCGLTTIRSFRKEQRCVLLFWYSIFYLLTLHPGN